METTETFRGLEDYASGRVYETADPAALPDDSGAEPTYDYDAVDPETFFSPGETDGDAIPQGHWRYDALLPFPARAALSASEGATPLVPTERLADELEGLEGGDGDLEALAAEADALKRQWHEQATRVSRARRQAARRFGQAVQEQLAFLAMDKATFEVELESREAPAAEGLEIARMLISANPGQPARPLAKVASGGELSRISLAIQVVAAQHSTIASLVFDEVDVGVSGATAEIVGQLLRRLGENGQVMTVTHLPQVAAQANHHLHIEKQADKASTLTRMALLDEAGRVGELARMLGGVNLSDRTLAHAREMLDASQRIHH